MQVKIQVVVAFLFVFLFTPIAIAEEPLSDDSKVPSTSKTADIPKMGTEEYGGLTQNMLEPSWLACLNEGLLTRNPRVVLLAVDLMCFANLVEGHGDQGNAGSVLPYNPEPFLMIVVDLATKTSNAEALRAAKQLAADPPPRGLGNAELAQRIDVTIASLQTRQEEFPQSGGFLNPFADIMRLQQQAIQQAMQVQQQAMQNQQGVIGDMHSIGGSGHQGGQHSLAHLMGGYREGATTGDVRSRLECCGWRVYYGKEIDALEYTKLLVALGGSIACVCPAPAQYYLQNLIEESLTAIATSVGQAAVDIGIDTLCGLIKDGRSATFNGVQVEGGIATYQHPSEVLPGIRVVFPDWDVPGPNTHQPYIRVRVGQGSAGGGTTPVPQPPDDALDARMRSMHPGAEVVVFGTFNFEGNGKPARRNMLFNGDSSPDIEKNYPHLTDNRLNSIWIDRQKVFSVDLFEHPQFEGRSVTINRPVPSLNQMNFSGATSSFSVNYR